jgi:hypothetical protein
MPSASTKNGEESQSGPFGFFGRGALAALGALGGLAALAALGEAEAGDALTEWESPMLGKGAAADGVSGEEGGVRRAASAGGVAAASRPKRGTP